MIDHLEEKEKNGYKFENDDSDVLRLAALLHDIGHIPMSHIGEEALQESVRSKDEEVTVEGYDKRKPTDWRSLFSKDWLGGTTKLHEALSAEIVLYDREIDKILREKWEGDDARKKIKERIASIIVGKDSTDIPTLLLHSELDADRLDFLLRDSFFTGVEYGKIDLDYIISRLSVVTGTDEIPHLCVEKKGLHTVEHYILGRFFLQTQVIWNRKVRLMDLLYEDVMKYMVRNGGAHWGLMDLRALLEHIRYEGEDYRKHVHEIYAYTDAQVFTKMRKLHEELDNEEKNRKAEDEEKYINDCVKRIMDGQVPEPVVGTHQRLVDMSSREGENFKRIVDEEAKKIADGLAEKHGIFRKRIIVNSVEEEVMKFKARMAEDEEANREAVRITYKDTGGKRRIIPAVESNASILKGLRDKVLVIFNVYYIQGKHEEKRAVEHEGLIREAYEEFVSRYFEAKTMGCGCESGHHMCQIVQEPDWLEEVKELSRQPAFVCGRCGRVSSDAKYLCEGVEI